MIENIKQVARRVLPKGSTLYLYGSRARGDYHEDIRQTALKYLPEDIKNVVSQFRRRYIRDAKL